MEPIAAPGMESQATVPFGHGLRAALRVVDDPPALEEAPAAPAINEPISPELVLVSPELREQALAALPVRDPNAFLKPPARPPVSLLRPVDDVGEDEAAPFRRLTLAAASYAALETGRAAVYGVLTIATVAGLATLATLFQ